MLWLIARQWQIVTNCPKKGSIKYNHDREHFHHFHYNLRSLKIQLPLGNTSQIKTFSFGHCPNYLSQIRASCTIFLTSKTTFYPHPPTFGTIVPNKTSIPYRERCFLTYFVSLVIKSIKCGKIVWKNFCWNRALLSGDTLLWDNRRILGKPIIVLTRQAQPTHD